MPETPTDELRAAADELDAARDEAADGEAADRLETLAGQLRRMSDAERGPEPRQLDRLTDEFREAEADLDGEAVAAVGSALAHVKAYRETVESV